MNAESGRRCLALAACILAVGCSSPAKSPGTVSGRVVSRLGPIGDAQVSIEDLTTETDGAGRFAIPGVAGGRHVLRAEVDGRQAGEAVVEVDGDTVADVSMLNPLELVMTDATPHSIALAWGAVASGGFRSYRLVRGYSAELPPESTTVVFDSDEPGATFYLDKGWAEDGGLQPDAAYYYRVYVENDRGTAASNVLEAHTRLWDSDDFDLHLELTVSAQIAAAATTTAITWDGERVWLTYYKEIGGYWDDDRNAVVALAEDGSELRRFEIEGRNHPIRGLTWFGDHLWLVWPTDSDEDPHDDLEEVDPTTGEVLRTLSVPYGTVDLDQDGTHILVLNRWNELYRVDPADGSLDATFALPFAFSTMTGVAHRDGRIWVNSWVHDELAILDLEGHQIGSAFGHYRLGGALAFVGDRLAQGGGARYVLQDLVEGEP